MADDYDVTIVFTLDTGNTENKAADAGQSAGKAFADGFKSNVDSAKVMEPLTLKPEHVSAFQEFGKTLGGVGKSAQDMGLQIGRGSEAARGLREALHVIRPVLGEAGIHMGRLGEFARLAGAGLPILGAAAGGVALVGLAKMTDQTTIAREKFKQLYDTKEQGTTAFDAISKGAETAGTSTKVLADGMAAVQEILGPNQSQSQIKDTAKELETLYGVIRSGSESTKEADKTFDDFTKQISAQQLKQDLTGERAKVTPEMIAALPTAAAKQIAPQFGAVDKAGLERAVAGMNVTVQDFFQRIRDMKVTIPAPDTGTFTKALDELGASLNAFPEKAGGEKISSFFANLTAGAAHGIEAAGKQIGELQKQPLMQVPAGAPPPGFLSPYTQAPEATPSGGFQPVPGGVPASSGAIESGMRSLLGLPTTAMPAGSALPQGNDIQEMLRSMLGVGAAMDKIPPAANAAAAAMDKVGQSSSQTPLPTPPQPDQKAGGGAVGGWGGPKSDSVPIMASKGEYVVRADGSNLRDAISFFGGRGYGGHAFAGGGFIGAALRGFANGGLIGGFADSIASIPGYASGGAVVPSSSSNTLGYHQLDLRTSAGTFSANVSEDTMQGIRNSALSGKLSQTGQRPSWYS